MSRTVGILHSMSSPNPDKRVGIIAKTLLTNREIPRMDLADTLKLDSGQISRALAGKRKWTIAEIETMAAFFNVGVGLFFEDPATLVRNRWFLRHELAAAS